MKDRRGYASNFKSKTYRFWPNRGVEFGWFVFLPFQFFKKQLGTISPGEKLLFRVQRQRDSNPGPLQYGRYSGLKNIDMKRFFQILRFFWKHFFCVSVFGQY